MLFFGLAPFFSPLGPTQCCYHLVVHRCYWHFHQVGTFDILVVLLQKPFLVKYISICRFRFYFLKIGFWKAKGILTLNPKRKI